MTFEARISLNFAERLLFKFWYGLFSERGLGKIEESYLLSCDLACILTAIRKMKVGRQEGEEEPYIGRLVWLFIF